MARRSLSADKYDMPIRDTLHDENCTVAVTPVMSAYRPSSRRSAGVGSVRAEHTAHKAPFII